MVKLLDSKSIYYNDVNLIAQPTSITSRKEIKINLSRIVVSPMSAVVGTKFTIEALKLGLTVCLHKFCSPKEQFLKYLKIKEKCEGNLDNLFVAIGLNDKERIDFFNKEIGSSKINWLIDCANGYLPRIKEVIDYIIKNSDTSNSIMIGNVMNRDGVNLYKDYFKKLKKINCTLFIRVGIAGGSACSTSDSTGYNRGQITEIIECSNEVKKFDNVKIIADGGIKNGNYASKAFGAGADYVMMGSYFSKAIEAETNIKGDGTYWGGASHKQQKLYGGIRRHSEGKINTIDLSNVKSLETLVKDLEWSLRSTVSYSGKNSLKDFIGNGVFEIKENSLPPKR